MVHAEGCLGCGMVPGGGSASAAFEEYGFASPTWKLAFTHILTTPARLTTMQPHARLVRAPHGDRSTRRDRHRQKRLETNVLVEPVLTYQLQGLGARLTCNRREHSRAKPACQAGLHSGNSGPATSALWAHGTRKCRVHMHTRHVANGDSLPGRLSCHWGCCKGWFGLTVRSAQSPPERKPRACR